MRAVRRLLAKLDEMTSLSIYVKYRSGGELTWRFGGVVFLLVFAVIFLFVIV